MGILTLGKLINPSDFYCYIEESTKLETVVHKYGSPMTIPDYPCWMEYKDEGNIPGSISFTRYTYRHPVLKKLTETMVKILEPIFPENVKPNAERIHLVKTTGFIPVHKDEDRRVTCINIGLKNSSGAITKISNSENKNEFFETCVSNKLKDGFGYLVNTNKFHMVESLNNKPRYLITYGFGQDFNTIKNVLRIKF